METKNALQALIATAGWENIDFIVPEKQIFVFQERLIRISKDDHPKTMHLDTPERMAKIIGVMMEALESIQSDSGTIQLLSNPPQHTWKRTATKALQQCQKIAEGE